mmetsp:Transcript_5930/g.8542  ORF Transcript_5930/g.8542 Transcript_5930/m.8542 type:complete len:88 (+) Transcript_5930:70-333(+)
MMPSVKRSTQTCCQIIPKRWIILHVPSKSKHAPAHSKKIQSALLVSSLVLCIDHFIDHNEFYSLISKIFRAISVWTRWLLTSSWRLI